MLKVAYLAKTILPKCLTTKLFLDFQNRMLHLSAPVVLEDGEVKEYPKADIYCSGSDQIWNPRANGGFNPVYFLSEANGKKVSYASSIGIHDLSELEEKQMKSYLREFANISVRELSSVPMLKEMGYDAFCALDPTLLLTQDDWTKFSHESIDEEPYLLVYYFGNAKDAMNTASLIAHKRGLKIRRIAVGFEKYACDEEIERFISPERFVSLFLNSSYVITNSFHGTIFSINFKKQFLTYPTTKKNARFDSVFQMFGLSDRNLQLYSSEEAVEIPDVDYSDVTQILNVRRRESGEYVEETLKIEG